LEEPLLQYPLLSEFAAKNTDFKEFLLFTLRQFPGREDGSHHDNSP
jgi:hypothetical protein